ncbi:MAG: adenylyl-sulfate kinase [Ignavibacteriaceae bacterium]
MIIWCTGLSGSGKTTICGLLMDLLKSNDHSVEWYDGDRVREELKIESDFSKEGILKNNFEVIDRINKVKDTVDYIIISLITPFNEVREHARKTFGKDYFEVYLKCDKETLVERDTKGLYKRALNGELDNLIGFSEKIPYEEPLKPDLILETHLITPDDAVKNIFNKLNILTQEQINFKGE